MKLQILLLKHSYLQIIVMLKNGKDLSKKKYDGLFLSNASDHISMFTSVINSQAFKNLWKIHHPESFCLKSTDDINPCSTPCE
jgi:hypothetical protein